MTGPQSTAGEASGLEVSIDPSALPLASNGNGAGLEPTAAALAALQQRQQEEAEEKVRGLSWHGLLKGAVPMRRPLLARRGVGGGCCAQRCRREAEEKMRGTAGIASVLGGGVVHE
eukprot:scaffold59875_cov22-Tisochrysis_lutea.AAC.1